MRSNIPKTVFLINCLSFLALPFSGFKVALNGSIGRRVNKNFLKALSDFSSFVIDMRGKTIEYEFNSTLRKITM